MLRDEDGMVVQTVPAAEVRAGAIRAARVYEARLLAGAEVEEDVEAEAGAILEAQTAVDIHKIADVVAAWWEAHT